MVLEQLETDQAASIARLAHSWHSSAAASDPWDTAGKTFEFHRKGADEAYRTVGKLLLPWYKRWELYDADKLVKLVEEFYAQERNPDFVRQRDAQKKKMRDEVSEALQEATALREGRMASRKHREALRQKGRTRGKRRG